MDSLLVISVKPEFMNLILLGVKQIELRKCRPSINKDKTLVVLYCTAPVKAVVGVCTIREYIEGSPESIWNKFSELVGIDKDRFFEYYRNRDRAFALKLDNVVKLSKKITLCQIRSKFPDFAPPQTYKYFNLQETENAFKLELNNDYDRIRRKTFRESF